MPNVQNVPKNISKNYCKDALEEFLAAESPEEKEFAGKFLYKRLIQTAEIDFRMQKASGGKQGGKIAKEIYTELLDRMYGKVAKVMEISGIDGDPIESIRTVEIILKDGKESGEV